MTVKGAVLPVIQPTKARKTMSRIIIPIPASQFPTRIEVYHNGELNRSGGVQPGATETSVKIPADISECEIRIIPCNSQGQAVGRGYVYKDETLVPEPPVHTDPPTECPEDVSENACCGKPEECEGTTESSEIKVEQSPDVQLVRAAECDDNCDVTVEPVSEASEVSETTGPDDRVYQYNTDDEGRLDSVDDVTNEEDKD